MTRLHRRCRRPACIRFWSGELQAAITSLFTHLKGRLEFELAYNNGEVRLLLSAQSLCHSLELIEAERGVRRRHVGESGRL